MGKESGGKWGGTFNRLSEMEFWCLKRGSMHRADREERGVLLEIKRAMIKLKRKCRVLEGQWAPRREEHRSLQTKRAMRFGDGSSWRILTELH